MNRYKIWEYSNPKEKRLFRQSWEMKKKKLKNYKKQGYLEIYYTSWKMLNYKINIKKAKKVENASTRTKAE